MYSEATLGKYIKKVKDLVKNFKKLPLGKLKTSFSYGNTKIGKVLNVSLPAIVTCGNCAKCKELCYDIKACIQYPGTTEARARNKAILEKDRDEYFRRISEKCRRRRKNLYFRWHVAGEIVDFDYFCRMVEVARENPRFLFWTYTKMYGIVNAYVDKYGREAIPENFIIMFSEWRGVPMKNPHGFPVFTVVFKGETEPENMWKCPGNCDVCKEAHRGCIKGENTYNLEH